MNPQQEPTSRPLGPDAIAAITSAYDLALLEIADNILELKIFSSSSTRTELSLAILNAFNSGVSDVQVLKMTGLAAVTLKFEFDNSMLGRGDEMLRGSSVPPVA